MEKHTEATIAELLRQKYSGDAWAFLTQVPDGTGMRKTRTADAMAISLWPSKGEGIIGFEIKVSRSDWLKEIQDPSKARAFSRFCASWYIVAPPGIVKPEELPAEWGLMVTLGRIDNDGDYTPGNVPTTSEETMPDKAPCPMCGRPNAERFEREYYCRRCDMLYDDDPGEGGDYHRDPSWRMEREERRAR